MLGNLWLNVIHANFGFLAGMMRNCQIVTIEFGNENPGLRTKCAWNFGKKHVVIRVLLVKNIKETVTCKVYAFMLRVICGIIHHANGRKIRDNFSVV